MKYLNSLLALSLAAVVFVPSVSAQVSANDYAPSQSPTAEQAPTVPPPSLEHMPQQMGQGGGGGQGRRGGRRGQMSGGGNGAGRARMMARFDANGDGVLDDAERAKAREWRAQHGKGKLGKQDGLGNGLSGAPGSGPSGVASGNFADSPLGLNNLPPGAAGNGGGGAGFGGGRRGMLGAGGGPNGANAQTRKQKLLQRFDTNGDGSLDAQEQASCDAFIAQKRQQRMQRMQQQGGGALGGPGGGGGFPAPGALSGGGGGLPEPGALSGGGGGLPEPGALSGSSTP